MALEESHPHHVHVRDEGVEDPLKDSGLRYLAYASRLSRISRDRAWHIPS